MPPSSNAIGEASSKLEGFGGKASRIAGNVGKLFAGVGVAAGGASVVIGKELLDVATDLKSLDQKSGRDSVLGPIAATSPVGLTTSLTGSG